MNILIFILLTFSASLLKEGHLRDHFVIWNIGQGQWATAVLLNECIHFDMGGEFFPWKRIHQACAKKENRIILSHADWDHVGALNKKSSLKKLERLCLQLAPLAGSKSRKKLWQGLPDCEGKIVGLKTWSPLLTKGKDSNSLSHIAIFRDFLIPGDSTKKEEINWRFKMDLSQVKMILLGHHGSRTSSSEELINGLPSTRQAVSSARWARYRHPHPEVIERLHRHRIALLRTEDWGNVWIEADGR